MTIRIAQTTLQCVLLCDSLCSSCYKKILEHKGNEEPRRTQSQI